DVINSLNSQNLDPAAGALESTANDFTIRVNRQYITPEQFAQLPITISGARSGSGGSATALASAPVPASAGDQPYVVRLGDIARLEEGADDRRRSFRSNGAEQIGFALTRQSQANDLQISAAVKEAIKQINPTLPGNAKLDLAVDYTVFMSKAI